MFGSYRNKVTRQTIEMVRQPLATFQHYYGTPPLFWRDEFVLGFFGSMIGHVSHVVSRGKLTVNDKGRLLFDCFSQLSNMNGIVIGTNFADLSHQRPQPPVFKNGVDNGAITTLSILGITADVDRIIVEEAKLEAERLNTPLPTYLITKLFLNPVKERFNLP